MNKTMKRTTVDVDTRRAVLMMARGRKPNEVARVPHEAFIRRTLKERMGYTHDEPASDAIKLAAKQMAAPLEAADKAKAEAKAKAAVKPVIVIDMPAEAANQDAVALAA
jgi:hypothetical protein